MLLAIDIGNSNTVVGLFDGDSLYNHFRVASVHTLTADECGFFITGLTERLNVRAAEIDRVVIASVVPHLTPVYEKMSEKYMGVRPLVVSCEIKLPIRIGYDDPASVGADRIANAVAAYSRFKSAAIVVDFGTATTFDVVNKDGIYLGGVIAPGPETSETELVKKAARLFEVRIERPSRVIGRNTADSMKSGLFFGTIGLIDTLVGLILNELGEPARVIATGGLCPEFADSCRSIELSDLTLTLEGLRIIADFQTVA
jgi:type III pantothenate kinase